MSKETLTGPALCGFSGMFDDDILGAITRAARGKPVVAQKKSTVKKGTGVKSGLPRNRTVDTHKKVLQRGRITAKKAVAATVKAKQLLQKHASKKLPVQVGAEVAKKLPAKAQAALRRQEAAMRKSQVAATALAQHAKAARASVIELAKALKKQKAVARSIRKPGSAKVGALVDAYYDMIGADPDPNNPGFLTDGSPDPAVTMDVSADLDMGGSESPMDSAVELPPAPPMDTFFEDADAVGGIGYDGSRGTPDGFALSYGLATRATDIKDVFDTAGIDGTRHYGYVFGRYSNNGPEKGIPFGDKLESGKWNHVHGRYVLFQFYQKFPDTTAGVNVVEPSEAHGMRRMNPDGVAYGPIIGNPEMPTFKGMRSDSKGRLFWLPQEAPEWLTFPLKQAAAIAAQAEQKAAAAAAKVEAAARAKEEADMAAEQARQEAANALAESQAASEQTVASAKQETQAQQEVLEQARSEREERSASAAQERQAGELLLREAQRRAAYFEQHPEIEFQPSLTEPGDEPEPEQPQPESDQGSDDYEERDWGEE